MNRVHVGPDILKDMEKQVHIIKWNLKVVRDRQKCYVDQHSVHK